MCVAQPLRWMKGPERRLECLELEVLLIGPNITDQNTYDILATPWLLVVGLA